MKTDPASQNKNWQVEERLPEQFNIDWPKLKTWFTSKSFTSRLAIIFVVVLLFNVCELLIPMKTKASGADLILLWDPSNGSIPSGWCQLSVYNNYFPIGASVAATEANWGTTFSAVGTRPYTPTTSSLTVSAPSASDDSEGGTNFEAATSTTANLASTQNPSLSMTSDSNGSASYPDDPLFRNLQLIEYGSSASGGLCTGNGIPNTIPKYAIALFDNGLPTSGWTELNGASGAPNQNGYVIRIGNSDTTGGGDTESNNITVSGLSGDGTGQTDESDSLGFGGNDLATPTHTHAPPSSMSCTSGCGTGTVTCPLQGTAGTTGTSTSTFTCTAAAADSMPPNISPVIAEANAATSTISVDLVGMFDGDPGSGWSVISNSGGTYSGEFVDPSATVNLTSTGTDTRPSETFSATTGPAIGTTSEGILLAVAGAGVDTPTHTHTYTITTNTYTTNSNVPPYFDIVYAEKVSFTLENYEWFTDNDAYNEVDSWPNRSVSSGTGVGVTSDQAIPAIPAPYNPPGIGTQLRLRIQILVSGQALAQNSTGFELQYAQTTATDCINGGTSGWQNLPAYGTSSVPWTYGSDSGLTDGTQLSSPGLLTPTSTYTETFAESSSGATTQNNEASGATPAYTVATGDTIEYDWVIEDTGATGATQYAFRPIETDGIFLSQYNGCPIVVTVPSTAQELRHGDFFQNNVQEGFEWANDPN